MRIIIETEVPQDCGSLFRVSVDDKHAGHSLTAAQAQLIAGDAIEAFIFEQRNAYRSIVAPELADAASRAQR